VAVSSTDSAVSKARQSLLDRGYKAWCENTAGTTRIKLGVRVHEPLQASLLAEKLGAVICALDKIPGLSSEALRHLSSSSDDEWSAVTVVCGDKEIIVINPSHSVGRMSTDLMHELSHLLLGHESAQTFISEEGFMIREYDEKQEAEADWLAGALLLPRKALEYIKYNHIPIEEVTQIYGVSRQLYNYRCRMTAVNRQYRY
jgi:Zn-dependent peptidase ImmA (M78 family)